jgi:16S rRNA C967 or C1407 C5-methylase (RsmB/RsmF family)
MEGDLWPLEYQLVEMADLNVGVRKESDRDKRSKRKQEKWRKNDRDKKIKRDEEKIKEKKHPNVIMTLLQTMFQARKFQRYVTCFKQEKPRDILFTQIEILF